MEIRDVTLMIEPGMPVWPGDDRVQLFRRQKLEEGESSNVSSLSLSVHTGTHVDAPFHFVQKGYTVENIPMELLVGWAQVVALADSINLIDEKVLQQAGIEKGVSRVLFKTVNSRFWQKGVTEFQKDFVAVSADGARWLVENGIRTVGIDALSIAPFTRSKPTHETLLLANVLIIEGLNLNDVMPGMWMMYCLPLKFKSSDGAPARVILVRE